MSLSVEYNRLVNEKIPIPYGWTRDVSNSYTAVKFMEYDKPLTSLTTGNYFALGKNVDLGIIGKVVTEFGTGRDTNAVQIGRTKYHRLLSNKICEIYGIDTSVGECTLTASATISNRSVVDWLTSSGETVFFSDQHNHNSIVRAITDITHKETHLFETKKIPKRTEKIVFDHLNYNQLEDLIKQWISKHGKHRSTPKCIVIITDGVFSMHGTFCNIARLDEIRKKYSSVNRQIKIVIDECHSIGIVKSGVLEYHGIPWNRNIIITGTLCKTMQSDGGYIIHPKDSSVEVLSTLTFTGIPTSLNCAISIENLKCVFGTTDLMSKLKSNVIIWRKLILEIFKKHFPLEKDFIWFYECNLNNPVPIVPFFLPFIKNVKTVNLEFICKNITRELFSEGIYVAVVFGQSIPRGHELLRTTVSVAFTTDELHENAKRLDLAVGKMILLIKKLH